MDIAERFWTRSWPLNRVQVLSNRSKYIFLGGVSGVTPQKNMCMINSAQARMKVYTNYV